MYKIIKLEKLSIFKPVKIGYISALKSLLLALKSFSDVGRQQGARIILAPLVGTIEMTAFSVMRTGANFATQGINTITGPVMPELMQFLALKDQAKVESMFEIIWLVLCVVLAPLVLIVQYFAPEFFPIWTRNKVEFDPIMYAIFSFSILVLALAQPAMAVIQGKNSLGLQVVISVLSGSLAILGIIILIPYFGLKGAAIAILFSEMFSLFFCVRWASVILLDIGLKWPKEAFNISSISVALGGIGLLLQIVLPASLMIYSLLLGLTLQLFICIFYWKSLPEIAQKRGMKLFSRFNIFKFNDKHNTGSK